MNKIYNMCVSHYNEPVLMEGQVARLVGYAEDDDDYYLLVKYPFGSRYKERNTWHTAVGGYIFLDKLKGQKEVVATTGDIWDDFTRLDSLLELNGAPKTNFFAMVSNSVL